MVLDEPLSGQKPADSEPNEYPSSKAAVLVTPLPSEDEARGLSVPEDDPPNPIDAGSLPPSNHNTEDQNVVATEDQIVFMDPSGVRWVLPFEKAKTLEGLKALTKRIQENTMYSYWDYKSFTDTETGYRRYSIVRLPEETNVLPETWEKLVQPGWQIKIKFLGNPRYIEDAWKKLAEAKAPVKSKETEGKTKPMEEISLGANIYQLDRAQLAHFISKQMFKEPIVNLRQAAERGSVLCEVRNVFIPAFKRDRSRTKDDAPIESDDIIGSCTLEIHSTPLLNALNAVIKFQSRDEQDTYQVYTVRDDSDSMGLKSGRFKFPYLDLYHHTDELVAYRSSMDESRQRHSEEYNRECDSHIDILIKYLHNQPSVAFSKAMLAFNQKVPVTTFSWLWLLLKPGSDVYVRERGQLNAYVIESVQGVSPHSTSRPRPYCVKVWNLDFDGKSLGRSSRVVRVPVFDGEREIQSLPLFPVRFYPDKEGQNPLRETLVERGKTFFNVIKHPTYREYTGPSSFSRGKMFNKVRVIVDHSSRPWESQVPDRQTDKHFPAVGTDDELGKNTRAPECSCTICTVVSSNAETLYRRVTFDEYDDISLDSECTLTDHQYLLCFSHVYGYVLQDRMWDLVEVQGLQPPQIDKNVINTLVMNPETNKDMIKAICETYTVKEDRESLFFADYIKGKGEGQIVLLHGPPGTGKTLTAESVSEYTQRPLLSITAADLGHEPEKLEANLVQFFRNATKWDAIVLLDEADIYLERRSVNEMRRNSIVSIFLRQLDYFQGILFLTTNRVGAFDEAFMSRIHIQIGYEPLDEPSRQKIWKNSFDKLEANAEHGGREILFSESAKEFVEESIKLKELKWNGREIRNAFQTAVALATFDAKLKNKSPAKVTREHLAQIVEMSSSFKKYMVSALGSDDSTIASRAFLRDDTFRLVPVQRTGTEG